MLALARYIFGLFYNSYKRGRRLRCGCRRLRKFLFRRG